MSESRVFVELVSFINKAVESRTLLFKLAELYSLYIDRLGDFGIKKLVNKTRLKVCLLQHFPEAQEQCDDKNVIIFKRGMEKMLNEALKKRRCSYSSQSSNDDAFDHHCSKFSGTFSSKCQEDSLPSSLKPLISCKKSQACLSVGQFILYNMKKASPCGTKTRHTLNRELPLPIYIGLDIHQQTRSKKLITQFHCMGISISYDRVMDLEKKDCFVSL